MSIAANALTEIHNSPPSPILHITPANASLRTQSFARHLGLPLIPLDEWLLRFDGFASRYSDGRPVLDLTEMLCGESAHGYDRANDNGPYTLPVNNYAMF
jgi:hypothetical protein